MKICTLLHWSTTSIYHKAAQNKLLSIKETILLIIMLWNAFFKTFLFTNVSWNSKEWIREPLVNMSAALILLALKKDKQLEIANNGGLKIMFQHFGLNLRHKNTAPIPTSYLLWKEICCTDGNQNKLTEDTGQKLLSPII